MKKSYLLEMTWEEFRDAVDAKTVMLVPMGSTELEGPHLPLGVDTVVAEGIARRLKGEDGVVIGPVLPIGYSKWFGPFPGTISLELETLTQVLTEYCACLLRHGIKRIVFLNSHRGNNACIDHVARTLVLERPVRVAMLSVWKMANELIAGRDLIGEGGFTHAGEVMTSVILALRPDLVDNSKMRPARAKSPKRGGFMVKNSLGETEFRGSVQMLYQHIQDVTDTGVFGDPTTATAEKGEQVLNLITDYAKAFLREFRNLPLAKKGS
ncbi:MAG: creatininase family protein [Deltaproteobacteria bacterium]